jgi:hypothetical protein
MPKQLVFRVSTNRSLISSRMSTGLAGGQAWLLLAVQKTKYV